MDELAHDASVDDASAIRALRAELPWKEWFVRDFLRYWYWLGAIVIDLFAPWSLADFFGLWEGYKVAIVFAVVVAFFLTELELYWRIWPHGPWRA